MERVNSGKFAKDGALEYEKGRMMKKQVLLIGICVIAVVVLVVAMLNSRCSHTFGEEVPIGKEGQEYAFERKCSECGKQTVSYYDAVLTFVDDDAKADALMHWEDIVDATGITMTSAVIGSKVQDKAEYEGYWSYADWETIHRLQNKGIDFVNHTYYHKNLSKFTEEQLREDFTMSQAVLSNHGVNADILVYPNNAYNDLVLEIVPQYFRAAVACGGEYNKAPLKNRYTIHRVNFNTSAIQKEVDFGNETVTCDGTLPLKRLKFHLEKAVDSKAWLIFMTHASDSPGGRMYFDEDAEQTLIEFCRYVQGLENVKIINLTQGVELMEKVS